jgi:hypothetical protein
LSLVSATELVNHPMWALQAGADGFVWWGADWYFMRLLDTPPAPDAPEYVIGNYVRMQEVFAEEVPPWMMIEGWIDYLHENIVRAYSVYATPPPPPPGLLVAGPCADVNGDGSVGFYDLSLMLAYWGACGSSPYDLDESGSVGFNDLSLLLAAWGPSAP